MSTNYLAVVSCLHCGEMIRTMPDGSIICACTTKRSCKHPEGMVGCHECDIARLQERVEELEGVLHGDKGAIADQRAVILALQARVEEAEGKGVCNSSVHCFCRYSAVIQVEIAKGRAEHAEALAERRKKALVHMTAYTEEWHPVTEDGCMVDEDIEEAHAAIEEEGK